MGALAACWVLKAATAFLRDSMCSTGAEAGDEAGSRPKGKEE